MDKTKTLLVIYSGDRIEHFDPAEAKYMIQRRIEKEGIEPIDAYIAEPFDYQPIVDAYYKEQSDYEEKASEARERREFERLKAKFEGK